MRIDELGQEFGLELEHEEVDSVSGLVLTLLGRPPDVGDTVRYGRLQFTVTARQGPRRRRGAPGLRWQVAPRAPRTQPT